MILVTLGTQDKPFERMLKIIEEQIDLNNIKEEVIVQKGCTKFKSKKMKMIDYLSMEEFNKLIKKCDLLITHGGVGSIIEGLKNNKKVIAIPRLKKYNEAANDHQVQIINKLSKEGYILSFNEGQDLNNILKKAKKFKPKKYVSQSKKMIQIIDKYLEQENSEYHPILILNMLLLLIILIVVMFYI